MDKHPPPATASSTATTPTVPSQPTEPPPPQPPPLQEQSAPTTPIPITSTTTTTTTTTSTANPNPNPPTASKATAAPSQPRPSSFSRPWQQHSHFSHFSSLPSSSPSSSAVTTPISAPPRGSIAIGVPAGRPTASPPQPAPPFSASFGQQFGGLPRPGVNVPDSLSTSGPLQARPQVQGMQGMGMMGSQMRPGGISVQHHQQRPVQQSPLRPPPSPPSSQSPATQNFQGQGLMRVSSVGSPGSPSPSTSQSMHNQPWLSSGPQGKPPLPPPTSYRPQMNSPSMQQRSHIPQPHIPLSTASQQQHVPSVQPQPKPSHQLPEHYGQQFPSSRVSQSLPHQQQITRASSSANQKPSSLATVQPNAVQAVTQSRTASGENDESGNRILSKRSINELVNQIDPSEKLDPEVEEILVDIAEDFVDSITTFGCSLAKHRKSDTLEAKDILLHLERNWNMTLPGFSGDEIKTYRKPLINDIHKERLAVIKKSIMATEVANTKTSVGQAAATAKGNLGKIPANIIGSS